MFPDYQPSSIAPAVSYTARSFVQGRLTSDLPDYGFNYLMKVTAATYKVQPFALSAQSSPPSLYLGRYDDQTLARATGVSSLNYPIAILSTAKSDEMAKEGMRVTPSTFSGSVYISVDFYISYPQGSIPPDGEAMYFAIEDAFISTFNTPDSYSLVPPGLIYNNQTLVEQGRMEWNGSHWIQMIPAALAFQVVV